MHGSLRPDSASSAPAEPGNKNNTGTATHPWLQLQTITPFGQMKASTAANSDEENCCNENVSMASNSSKSSHSDSDESLELAHDSGRSHKPHGHKKKLKLYNERHSDPSHDRQISRRASNSSFVEQGSGDHILQSEEFSLKHKISSSASQRRSERQQSASTDERVSHVINSNNDNYGVAVNGSKAVRAVHNRLSSSLLIESLIDQLCKMMASEKKQQQTLYKIICTKLYEMRLIDGTYAVDELQIVRNHYQKALYQMLSVAKSATQASHQRNVLLPLPSVKMEIPLGHNVMEVSRYKDEFDELKFLAKGGFGKVYRVRHRLDGACYAVKKIYFRNNDHILQSMREVKMLANLNHPNVVSYKAAWIEPVEYNDYESISSTSTRSTATDTNNSSNLNQINQLPSFQEADGQESDDIIFADTTEDDKRDDVEDSLERKAKNTRITVEYVDEQMTKRTVTTVSFGNGAGFKNSFLESKTKSKTSSTVSNAVLPYRSSTVSREIRGKCVSMAILYVQMQLCESTLRQWLDKRNISSTSDISTNISTGLSLFRQIVQGVEYIHNQKIIHHDIKPSNIFLSKDLSLVQVGDFGLSCWFRPQLKHGCNIGTPQYAAPEQRKGECDPKSDIFSLGIILVEILVPFRTVMERAEIMNNVRKGNLPPELEAVAPAIAALVKMLIDPMPRHRPTASELLEKLQDTQRLKCAGEYLDEKNKLFNEISAKYEAVIELKDRELKSKDKVIESKDREIFELKRLLQELGRSGSKEDEEEANILP